ncbi:MAG: hypothetical protein WKF81_09525 [Thermomicrobiales bacterium]
MTSPDQPTRRPVLAYGATPGRLGILSRAIETADQAELLALDLDLRSSWAIPRVSALTQASQERSIRLRSVWLPGDISGLVSERRQQSLDALLVAAKERFGLRALVVPRHQGQGDRGAAIHKLARGIASSKSGSQIRLVIGLQASDFRHDRWHLDQLAGIRRMAEEWDLDLALDLTGNVSLAWEAEAAILRVFPRLTLVRLGQWRREDGTLVPNLTGQIAGRTISMLVDQGYSGVVSLVADRRSSGAALLHEKQDVLQRFVRDSPGVSPKVDAPISDFTRHDR